MNIVSLPPEEEQTSFDYYNIFKPLKFLYKSYKVSSLAHCSKKNNCSSYLQIQKNSVQQRA